MVKNYAALGHIPSGFVQGIHFHNKKCTFTNTSKLIFSHSKMPLKIFVVFTKFYNFSANFCHQRDRIMQSCEQRRHDEDERIRAENKPP